MASLLPVEFRSADSQLVGLPAHARLPRLDLGIDWESRGEIFRSSVAGVLTGPPTPKDWELKRIRTPRIDWIEGKMPGRAFMAEQNTGGDGPDMAFRERVRLANAEAIDVAACVA